VFFCPNPLTATNLYRRGSLVAEYVLTPREIVQAIESYNWRFELTDGKPKLVAAVNAGELPPQLVNEIKDNREEVLAYLSVCAVCGRDVSDPEDRVRLNDPLLCDRGGSKKSGINGHGERYEATPRCPYKDV
jgi:hypothetical protein